jgi:hypothetical protein
MHSALSRTAALTLAGLAIVAGALTAQQVTVSSVGASTSTAVGRAEAMLREGRRSEAADFLSQFLAQQPNDGQAWFFLGRMHLDDAQAWHRNGHPSGTAGPLQLDFAATAFEQAQRLLADSALVFRVLVGVERATLMIEEGGWNALAGWTPTAVDLPLPPVLRELGANLLASCPRQGVLLAGSLVETAAAWGDRLVTATRADLMLVRTDLFAVDPQYRGAVTQDLGAPSDASLAQLVAAAGAHRPVCLAPLEDTTLAGAQTWRRQGIALVTGAVTPPDSARVAVFELGRSGPAAPLWVVEVRDIYDRAARRNPAFCQTLRTVSTRKSLEFPSCHP